MHVCKISHIEIISESYGDGDSATAYGAHHWGAIRRNFLCDNAPPMLIYIVHGLAE